MDIDLVEVVRERLIELFLRDKSEMRARDQVGTVQKRDPRIGKGFCVKHIHCSHARSPRLTRCQKRAQRPEPRARCSQTRRLSHPGQISRCDDAPCFRLQAHMKGDGIAAEKEGLSAVRDGFSGGFRLGAPVRGPQPDHLHPEHSGTASNGSGNAARAIKPETSPAQSPANASLPVPFLDRRHLFRQLVHGSKDHGPGQLGLSVGGGATMQV